MTTYKYSLRIIGTFEGADYASAQAAAISAFGALANGKLQSIELSQWEQPVEDETAAETAADSGAE